MSRYLLFYKPYRVLCGSTDEQGRPTLAQYVPAPGLFEAGRLDYDSEGLILLTDDGGLAHRLTHPLYRQPKTYLVQVQGLPDEAALRALRSGVPVKGERRRTGRPGKIRARPGAGRRSHRLAAAGIAGRAQERDPPHDRGRGPPHSAPGARRHRSPGARRLTAWAMA
jgi:16S rRNA U516 pseudouridylate synthase RsuA-like enzyme